MTQIVWIRHNLRLSDNPPLVHAAREGRVILVFLWDRSTETLPDGARKWWRQESLQRLGEQCESLGLSLLLFRGPAEERLLELFRKHPFSTVHAQRGITGAERAQEERVERALKAQKIAFTLYPSDYLISPERIPEGRKGPWRIFTPFWRHYRPRLFPDPPLPVPQEMAGISGLSGERLSEWGWDPKAPDWAGGLRSRWRPGETAAQERLRHFVEGALRTYDQCRDRVDLEGTSGLSPYLAAGEVSCRQVYWAVRNADVGEATREKFLSELGWREFAAHQLWHWPEMEQAPLRPEYHAYPWQNGGPLLQFWKKGRTGIPFVDAGMRELRQTGGLHNRHRMAVASFLVKNLEISWQVGARWFADNLVDYDPASNAFSWQWVAGCGTDASPFFRIFNPILQGERFDPQGIHVRRFLPELRRLSDRSVHRPWEVSVEMKTESPGGPLPYPSPVVDLALSRQRSLSHFQSLFRLL